MSICPQSTNFSALWLFLACCFFNYSAFRFEPSDSVSGKSLYRCLLSSFQTSLESSVEKNEKMPGFLTANRVVADKQMYERSRDFPNSRRGSLQDEGAPLYIPRVQGLHLNACRHFSILKTNQVTIDQHNQYPEKVLH